MNNIEEIFNNKNLVFKLAKILCNNNLTISTAESCTGGMIAAELISYPGISKVYLEGAITYSNESKVNRLNVDKKTLDKYGAVSKETANEMAKGIANASDSKISIISTGIAGPDGGSEEKPVGLVYIAMFLEGEVKVHKFIFNGDRDSIRKQSTINALTILLNELETKGYK